LAVIEQAKERSTSILRKLYRSEADSLFLDLFEDEYSEFCKFRINVEYLMMDANLLLPPSQLSTAMMSGLHFTRRLPCDDLERSRYVSAAQKDKIDNKLII
jgi:protein CLEC16A